MIKSQKVQPENGYRCPFCTDHDDEEFFIWKDFIETPICEGCVRELGYFFLTPPDEGIWFGFDLQSIKTSTLERITGKSINVLQLSYLVNSLNQFRDHKILENKIIYYSKNMDDNEKKIFRRQQKGHWIEGIRHRKMLIRKLFRLKKKMQEGTEYGEVISQWYDARHINKERHSK